LKIVAVAGLVVRPLNINSPARSSSWPVVESLLVQKSIIKSFLSLFRVRIQGEMAGSLKKVRELLESFDERNER
jgi:hypothetical protein